MESQTPYRRIALVDGNNFYCSCEQSLSPALQQQPLVVLSNNDGCAISRTEQAKALGITMGAPWFQLKHLQRSHGLHVRSANFNLYGELSQRMMQVLRHYSPLVQEYSIDEAFLDLSGSQEPGRTIASRMKAQVQQWLGLPICVGIARSHTLAKLANYYAKKMPHLAGICDLSTLEGGALLRALRHAPIEQVWGIGRRLAPQMRVLGIHTAADLAQASVAQLQQQFSVVVARIAKEVRGESCLPWENRPLARQQIMYTRSFGQPINDKTQLAQALSTFTSAATHTLRAQNSLTSALQVQLRTRQQQPKRQNSLSTVITLLHPTDNVLLLTNAAIDGLNMLYRSGFYYDKAGVCLLDLSSTAQPQQTVLNFNTDSADTNSRSALLMETLDRIHQRYGRSSVVLGSALSDADAGWHMQQHHKSPSYTTHWADLPWVGEK